MNFFEKYFPTSSFNNLQEESEVSKVYVNFVTDWVSKVNFDIEAFTNKEFKSLKEALTQNEYWMSERSSEEKEAVFFRIYYSALSMCLVVQERNVEILKSFIKVSNDFDSYSITPDLRSFFNWSHYLRDTTIQKVFEDLYEKSTLILGLIINTIFRDTIYCRPSLRSGESFKDSLNILVTKDIVFGEFFLSLFDALYDHHDKLDRFLQMLYSKKEQENVNRELYDDITKRFNQEIEKYNNEHILQLDYEVLSFHYQELCLRNIFDKDKVRDKNTLNHLTEVVKKSGKQVVLDNFIYLINYNWLPQDKRFSKAYVQQFMYPISVSKQWLKEVFSPKGQSFSQVTIDLVYAPLLIEREYKSDDYSLYWEVVHEMAYYDYRQHNRYLNTDLTKYLQDVVPPSLAISRNGCDLNRQLYSGIYETIFRETPTDHPQIDLLVKWLNYYGVCALKEMHKSVYIEEYKEVMCVLNFNGKDYELQRFDIPLLAQAVTGIFIDHNIPYIMCAVKIYKREFVHYKTKEVYSYCICNREQLELLASVYDMTIPGARELPYGEADFFEVINRAVDIVEDNKRSPQLVWFYEAYFKEVKDKEVFIEIIEYLYRTKVQKKVDTKWLSEFNTLFSKQQIIAFTEHLSYVFSLTKNEEFWLTGEMANIQKNLVIVLVNYLEETKAVLLVKGLIENAYKKVYGVGAKMVATGNFLLEILAKCDKENAFGIMTQLRESTKYNSFLKALDKYIAMFLSSTTLSANLLRDKTTPSYGFDKEGVEQIVIAEWGNIVLKIENAKLNKYWVLEDGTVKKTLPKTLDEVYDMKALALYIKELNKTLVQLKNRIRLYWLEENVWSASDWTTYIKGHHLMGNILKNMIWLTDKGQEFMYGENHVCVDNLGNVVVLDENEQVRLWHPLLVSTERLIVWQKYVLEHNIQQIEKQVFRECYALTAEETECSYQFADHYLLNNKLMAVSNAIGWVFPYSHYGEGHPRKYLPHLNMSIHFMLDYDRHATANRSKEVIFCKGDNTKESDMMSMNKFTRVNIAEVSPMVISELFRDIDLLVATTSIVNNPDLKEEFELYDDYLKEYKLGKLSQSGSAKTRRQIIGNLAGFLGIDLIGFEGNFMLIKGKGGDYRINLGSGFVQDAVTNQHVDMRVTKGSLSKDQKVRIPLIEDDTLAVIIAKAKSLS